MSIGKSVSIKNYGSPNGYWVIQTEWGREIRSNFCKSIEDARVLAKNWEDWFCN